VTEPQPSTAGSISWSCDQQVARVLISHPGHLNALTTSMWHQLRECFSEIARHSELRVAVIQGAGEAFAAGADISEFPRVRANRDQVREFHDQMIAPALAAIVHCPVPVLAAIDGPCVGGGLEIASVCDIRVASDRSRFGIPINRLGFPLAPAEAAGLVSLVGRAVSLEILLEGRILSAEEAYEKGLVSRVVPLALWADEVNATIDRLCAGAPHAARRNKWLIHLLSELSDAARLSPGQREACWDFVETQDYARGLDAFMSKTNPKFEDN
jgi:enoyl-CoA hydratase/carnithine racemase